MGKLSTDLSARDDEVKNLHLLVSKLETEASAVREEATLSKGIVAKHAADLDRLRAEREVMRAEVTRSADSVQVLSEWLVTLETDQQLLADDNALMRVELLQGVAKAETLRNQQEGECHTCLLYPCSLASEFDSQVIVGLRGRVSELEADLIASQAAFNSAQSELDAHSQRVTAVCNEVEAGDPAGSSLLGRLAALPRRIEARALDALRIGVSHTLVLTMSHYELDLPRISEGLVVTEEEVGRESEVLAELVQEAEASRAPSALVGIFAPAAVPASAVEAGAAGATDADAQGSGGSDAPQ